jgi:hypothetical protein
MYTKNITRNFTFVVREKKRYEMNLNFFNHKLFTIMINISFSEFLNILQFFYNIFNNKI